MTRARYRAFSGAAAAMAGIAAVSAPPSTAAVQENPAQTAAGAEIPDIAQALLRTAYETRDPAEIVAVARAVKAVFPDNAEAINAQSQAALAALAAAPQDEDGAAQPPPPSPQPSGLFALRPWEGKINASGLLSDGNSENIAGGLAVEGARKAGPLTHNVKGFVDIGRSGGVTNQKRWGASYQLNVDLSDRTYAYARILYEEDEFSGFDYRIFSGAGLGHFFYDVETFAWKIEGGPGFRYSPIDETREVDQNAAFFASTEVDWVIRDGVTFSQDLNATWTEPTTTLQSVTKLDTKLTEAISTGLSFEYRYETDPPADRENFDAIARASLIYGF